MRAVIIAVALVGVLLAVLSTADVIVFKNGSRMEVDSFEIKGRVVIVATKGSLQSLPVDYVDLEATRRANARANGTRGKPCSSHDHCGQRRAKVRQAPLHAAMIGQLAMRIAPYHSWA